ncbi:MAG: O-antigen ligase family protein [Paenibacillus sp.]|nr:O-antigen ligase family protein [Paenibacillus sp.]
MSKPVYGKNALQSRNVEKIPSPVWAMVVAFILFLLWTPFQVGLFNGQMVDFEKPLYVSALLSALMMLVWVGLYYKKFKLEQQSDLVVAAALLLPITYALSLFVAVSHYMAMNMLFIQSMYAAVFIITFYLLKQKQLNVVIQNALLAIAYFIVGFGLLNWLGGAKVAGALVGWFSNTVSNGKYLDAVMTDSNGLRLTSIFQYANTYAAFLMAFLFVAVFALIRSRKWYGTLTHGFILVPIIVSILLTLSRGGLVLLPVVFILLLLFLKPAQQILWILHLGIAGIASVIIASPVTNLGTELNTKFSSSAALKGWGYLLGASLLVAGLSWVVQRFVAPWLNEKLGNWGSRKLTGLWIPLGSVALIGMVAFLLVGTSARSILPANMETRLENINFNQHSVLERFTFYKDALKVVKDYPILGAGGGGWASLYEQYQNNPYTSRQVHNFFLQYLIEVGILGFIVFMSFILYIFYKYIRSYIKRDKNDFDNGFFYLIIALSILVHSLLDFNMSYAFMGILVFLGLAGMAAVMDSKPLKRNWNQNGIRMGYLAVLTVGTAFLLFLSISYLGSSSAAAKAKNLLGVSQSYEEIKEPLVKALKNRPSHPESAAYLSSIDQQVFSQTQDEQYLNESYNTLVRALKDEPYNKNLLTQLVSYYDLKSQNDLSYAIYRDNADKFNWDIEWYEALISRSYSLGHEAYAQKNEAKEKEYFTTGLNAYTHVEAGVEHLKTLPPEQLQGRPFAITPTMALNAGKMQLMSGQGEAAAKTLKLGLSEDYTDLNNREIARWYLAALKSGGGQDQAVYDLLIAAEPLEAKQIDEIVNQKY